jgi:hypothetical protein
MKADLRWEDGPEREELRTTLRHWKVPGPPPEIEEDLRRTFRRRRARGRRALWPSIAAATVLALLAVWRIGVKDRPATTAPTGRAAAVPTPSPRRPTAVAVGRSPSSAPVGLEPAAAVGAVRLPRPTRAQAEVEVIVEPGQAGLLAEFGRTLRTVRQAAPGTPVPRIEGASRETPVALAGASATDVPTYRGDWETVAGEWPLVHRSRPGR